MTNAGTSTPEPTTPGWSVRVRLVAGVALLTLAALLLTANTGAEAQQRTLRVPQDYASVQQAVDASRAGDLILVGKGTYHEAVFVGPEHSGITIRGVDRNEVVFDGKNELGTAIEVNGADDVVLENMTAHDYVGNGFYWQSADGFRGSYLTAYRIGVYAIFSFDSANGVFEHSYASGSADASFYVGQCFPCNIRLTNLTAEYSALGYSGTNAGGDLILEDSLWQNNGAGILPNSLTSEANPPQRQATIRNNVLRANNNLDTPAKGLSGSVVGVGIGIAGGNENVVEGNTVEDHDKYGIAIFPLPEPDPLWIPVGNVVKANTVSGSGLADLTVTAGSGEGNCFVDNEFATSDPPQIESTHPCQGSGLNSVPASNGSPVSAGVLAAEFAQAQAGTQGRPAYTTMPDAPADLPSMPADHQPASPPNGEDSGECCVGHDDGESRTPQIPGREAPISNGAPGSPRGDVDGGNAPDGSAELTGAAQSVSQLPTTGGGIASGLAGLVLIGSALRLRRRPAA